MSIEQNIIEALAESVSLKNKTIENKKLLNELAFELGVDQSMLGKIGIIDFLNGYLTAKGFPLRYSYMKAGD